MAMSRFEEFEERLQRRRRMAQLPLRRLKDRSNPLEYYNFLEFKARFHMNKETALYITTMIQDTISSQVRRGCHLSPIYQFLVAAHFYATGSFQIIVGDVNSLSQGAVSKIVKRVSTAVASLSKRFIKYPNQNEIALVRRNFYEIGNFPGNFTFHSALSYF